MNLAVEVRTNSLQRDCYMLFEYNSKDTYCICTILKMIIWAICIGKYIKTTQYADSYGTA